MNTTFSTGQISAMAFDQQPLYLLFTWVVRRGGGEGGRQHFQWPQVSVLRQADSLLVTGQCLWTCRVFSLGLGILEQ